MFRWRFWKHSKRFNAFLLLKHPRQLKKIMTQLCTQDKEYKNTESRSLMQKQYKALHKHSALLYSLSKSRRIKQQKNSNTESPGGSIWPTSFPKKQKLRKQGVPSSVTASRLPRLSKRATFWTEDHVVSINACILRVYNFNSLLVESAWSEKQPLIGWSLLCCKSSGSSVVILLLKRLHRNFLFPLPAFFIAGRGEKGIR